MNGVTLRASTQEDAGFVYALLRATMQAYVVQTWGWDEREQQARFAEDFDPGRDRVIVLDGRDIGLIGAERNADGIFLDNVYILPEYQRRGIGTHLIKAVLEEAFHAGLPVTLRVLKVNPARRLYERLGFAVVGETDASYLMSAVPRGPQSPPSGSARCQGLLVQELPDG